MRYPHPPRFPGHLTQCWLHRHGLELSFSFGPSPSVFSHGWPRLGLLRPLLTSRSTSSVSPFQAQGEISPGKNARLHHTTARFTPPDPWSQKLHGLLPACLGRRRLLSGSCPSARDLRFTLPSHNRSPSCSCACASLTVTSSWEDLHLQECAHAGRTNKKARRSGPIKTGLYKSVRYFATTLAHSKAS
jgi:hypothetical protein